MSQKGFGFARTFIILLVGFSIMGNYLYNENSQLILNRYLYYTNYTSLFRYEFPPIELEGGHEYTIFFIVQGGIDTVLRADFEFESAENFEHIQTSESEKTWLRSWGRTERFLDPIVIENDQTLNVSIILTTRNVDSDVAWQMVIYQDLPEIFTHDEFFIILFDIFALTLWVIAWNQYEKVFDDIREGKYTEQELIESTQNSSDLEDE